MCFVTPKKIYHNGGRKVRYGERAAPTNVGGNKKRPRDAIVRTCIGVFGITIILLPWYNMWPHIQKKLKTKKTRMIPGVG